MLGWDRKRRKHVRITPPTGHEFPIGVALVLKNFIFVYPPPLSVYSEWEQCLLTFKSNADVQTANDSLLETKFLNGKGGGNVYT